MIHHVYYDYVSMTPPWVNPRRPADAVVITRSERLRCNVITLTRTGPHAGLFDADDKSFENRCEFPQYINWFVYQNVTR